ncbi:MAG: hypothetical protein OXC26_17555 [Albidovulum sp.]|nr:hypothetical protein [Albidovulum sp.]
MPRLAATAIRQGKKRRRFRALEASGISNRIIADLLARHHYTVDAGGTRYRGGRSFRAGTEESRGLHAIIQGDLGLARRNLRDRFYDGIAKYIEDM